MNNFEYKIVNPLSRAHFKGLDTRNLQYEIRICQKTHIKVTMSISICIFGKFLNQKLA